MLREQLAPSARLLRFHVEGKLSCEWGGGAGQTAFVHESFLVPTARTSHVFSLHISAPHALIPARRCAAPLLCMPL
jgi:hypothetical protein